MSYSRLFLAFLLFCRTSKSSSPKHHVPLASSTTHMPKGFIAASLIRTWKGRNDISVRHDFWTKPVPLHDSCSDCTLQKPSVCGSANGSSLNDFPVWSRFESNLLGHRSGKKKFGFIRTQEGRIVTVDTSHRVHKAGSLYRPDPQPN